MKLRCHAKINLVLDVLNRREDNFHNLDSIMLLVSLYDELEVKLNKSGEINITTFGMNLKKEDNLIYKCLNLLKNEYNFTEGFDVYLNKKIPLESGLGGGSSDAAGALKAANELLKLNLSLDELALRGSQVGSDIPFLFLINTLELKIKVKKLLPLRK